MKDWFESICSWRDEDDDWKPTIYAVYDDYVELDGEQYLCRFTERDWHVLGNTPGENLAMGRVCIIDPHIHNPDSFGNTVFTTCGKTFDVALKRLKTTYQYVKTWNERHLNST